MNQVFEQFKNKISSMVSEAEKEYNKILVDIESVKENQKAEIERYNKIKSGVDDLRGEESSIRSDLKKRTAAIEESERAVLIEREKLTKEKAAICNEIDNLKSSRDSLKLEIDSLTSRSKEVQSMRAVKEVLEHEIKDLSSILQNKKTQIEKLEIESKEKLSNTLKELAAAEGKLEKTIKENDSEFNKLKPRIEQLNKKEEELSEKERALNVVESRYKKMFGDAGISFKL